MKTSQLILLAALVGLIAGCESGGGSDDPYILPAEPPAEPPADSPADNAVTVADKEWLQPADFTGYIYDQVNAVCPGPDGVCSGSLQGSTFDLTGYTWASIDDASSLFNAYGVTPPFTEPFQVRDDYDAGVAFKADFELYGLVCDAGVDDCSSTSPGFVAMLRNPPLPGSWAYTADVGELYIPEVYRFFNGVSHPYPGTSIAPLFYKTLQDTVQ